MFSTFGDFDLFVVLVNFEDISRAGWGESTGDLWFNNRPQSCHRFWTEVYKPQPPGPSPLPPEFEAPDQRKHQNSLNTHMH
jgi:hypothetical protein